jgi:hypothetical protein
MMHTPKMNIKPIQSNLSITKPYPFPLFCSHLLNASSTPANTVADITYEFV